MKAVLVVGALLSLACSAELARCAVACGPGGACPSGRSCLADGFCHEAGEPPECGIDSALPDGKAGADAAGGDAGPSDASPDAASDAAASRVDAPPADARDGPPGDGPRDGPCGPSPPCPVGDGGLPALPDAESD